MTEAARRELAQAACAVRTRAYAPYSQFQVGAAVRASSGRIYIGVNVENASYGATICAERSAVCQAITAGERCLEAIAICGGKEGAEVGFCPPCGICRQTLREFCNPKNFEVLLVKDPNVIKTFSLLDLLPESFGPENVRP